MSQEGKAEAKDRRHHDDMIAIGWGANSHSRVRTADGAGEAESAHYKAHPVRVEENVARARPSVQRQSKQIRRAENCRRR